MIKIFWQFIIVLLLSLCGTTFIFAQNKQPKIPFIIPKPLITKYHKISGKEKNKRVIDKALKSYRKTNYQEMAKQLVSITSSNDIVSTEPQSYFLASILLAHFNLVPAKDLTTNNTALAEKIVAEISTNTNIFEKSKTIINQFYAEDITYLLALTLEAQKKHLDAISEYEKIHQGKNKNNWYYRDALYQRAISLLNAKKPKAASDFFIKYYKKNKKPSHQYLRALYEVGLYYQATDNNKKAQRNFISIINKSYLKKYNLYSKSFFQLKEIYIKQNKSNLVEGLFNRAYRTFSREPIRQQFVYALGQFFIKQKDYKKAYRYFFKISKAKKIISEEYTFKTFVTLHNLYEANNETPLVEATLKQLSDLVKEKSNIRNLISTEADSTTISSKSEANYWLTILQIEHLSNSIIQKIAVLCLNAYENKLLNENNVLLVYNKFFSSSPPMDLSSKYRESYANMIKTKPYELESLKTLLTTRSSTMNDSNEKIDVLYELAFISKLEGSYEKAVEQYQNIFINYPLARSSVHALFALAAISMEIGEVLEVEIACERIKNLYPTKKVNAKINLQLANYYNKKKLMDKRNQLLKLIINNYPDTPEAETSKQLLSK